MYDFYAQKSNYPFKGKVFNQYRYFQEDKRILVEDDSDTKISGHWKSNNKLNALPIFALSLVWYFQFTVKHSTGSVAGKTLDYDQLSYTLLDDGGTCLFAYSSTRHVGRFIYNNLQGKIFSEIDEINVITEPVAKKNLMLILKAIATRVVVYDYKKGEKNPYFKVDGEEFMFNITSYNNVEKKQPLTNFIVKAEQMTIDTKFKHPFFVQGGYIEYDGRLWIIKTVNEEKGPQKSIYQFFSINPLSTTKMLVEEAQENDV